MFIQVSNKRLEKINFIWTISILIKIKSTSFFFFNQILINTSLELISSFPFQNSNEHFSQQIFREIKIAVYSFNTDIFNIFEKFLSLENLPGQIFYTLVLE